jgi:hypothetical protein
VQYYVDVAWVHDQVAMLLINGKRARNEYFKRIGRRAYEL